MFPSGTRHATALKGGMALIAKMAKVKIVPSVYQGPLTLKDLFKRKRVTVRFGSPLTSVTSKRWTKRAWRKWNGASKVHLTHWIKRSIRHLFIKSMSPKEKINTQEKPLILCDQRLFSNDLIQQFESKFGPWFQIFQQRQLLLGIAPTLFFGRLGEGSKRSAIRFCTDQRYHCR